jgi:hypothetical protein
MTESFPSLGQQMAAAVRRQFDHAAASHKIDRRGWTREQWVADARRLLEELDGSVLDLLNGHVAYMLNEIDVLNHRLASQEDGLDWRSIAGRIYLDNGGYNLLSTSERDEAELAAEEEGERRWGVDRERTVDAMEGME